MNRADRRRARRAGVPEIAIRFAETYACPDCDADTTMDVDDGIPVLSVAHDSTCPALAGRTSRYPR